METDVTMLNLDRVLGPLEAEILEIVWQEGQVTVRDVYRILLRRKDIAYTTVLTVLRNLNRKGILNRQRDGQAYVYTATVNKDEFTRARVTHIVDLLLDQFPGPAMERLRERLGMDIEQVEARR